ncbi:hypothetical protein Pcinc_008579 [Petrolisthes cinctipes]|uniref:Uncharacterized protein n=1 Tax=Petrolisthes cinctipes TaxID=88211 RepID=A0AAE1G8P6_PETCI|nr:hypothetical protein Pcinc_008579 [Petrolisthes cinctipes]
MSIYNDLMLSSDSEMEVLDAEGGEKATTLKTDSSYFSSSSESSSSDDEQQPPTRKRYIKKTKKTNRSLLDLDESMEKKLERLMMAQEDDKDEDSSFREEPHTAPSLTKIYMSSSDDYEDRDDFMRSILNNKEDDDSDNDSDFDPNEILKQLEENVGEGGSDSVSVVSSASSSATWSSLSAAKSPAARKKRRVCEDVKYVRVSQTALSINALKDEFSMSLSSLSSSLAFASLSTRSSEIAAAIVDRASNKQLLKNVGNPNILDMPTPTALRSRRVNSASNSKLPPTDTPTSLTWHPM